MQKKKFSFDPESKEIFQDTDFLNTVVIKDYTEKYSKQNIFKIV